MSDSARITGSVKDYAAAIEKYHRAADIDSADTAALHSCHHTLLSLADISTKSKKERILDKAQAVSRELKRRRSLLMKKQGLL